MWGRLLSKSLQAPKLDIRNLTKNALTSPASLQKNPDQSKEMRTEVQKILGIREFEAFNLLDSNRKLLSTPASLIKQNYEICTKNGLNSNTVLKYPFLLSDTKLEEKIAKLQCLPNELSSNISLAKLSLRQIRLVVLKGNAFDQRVNDLSAIFGRKPDEIHDILSTKRFMITLPLDYLEDLLNTYYKLGFTKEDILNDLWILKYSKEFIENRLKLIREYNIASLKTWMIRCPKDTLYRHVEREWENRGILGEHSIAQYLSNKLGCSEHFAKNVIRKHPQLQNKSLLKMNSMIDLLHKEGFNSGHICKAPKILLHGTETTAERLRFLRKLGKMPHSLYVLTKSQKQYAIYVDNLVKLKEKSTE